MIGRDKIRDFYNLFASKPTDNAGCMAGFRKSVGRRAGLPATK